MCNNVGKRLKNKKQINKIKQQKKKCNKKMKTKMKQK